MTPLRDIVSDMGAVCGEELWPVDEQQVELIFPTDEPPEQHGGLDYVVEQPKQESPLIEQVKDVQSYALGEQDQVRPGDIIQQQVMLVRQQGVLIQEQEQLMQQHNQNQYGQWQHANELLEQEQEGLLIQQEDLLIHRQELIVRHREQDDADHRQQQTLIRQQEQIIQQQELLIRQQKVDNGDVRQQENDQGQVVVLDEEHIRREIQASHDAEATGLVDAHAQQLCLDVDREDMPRSTSPEPHQQHSFPTDEETVQQFRTRRLSIIGSEDRVDSSDHDSVPTMDGSLESCAAKPGTLEPVRQADPFRLYESHVYDGMYEKVYTDHECRPSSPPEVVSVADVSFDVTGGPDSVAQGHQPPHSVAVVHQPRDSLAVVHQSRDWLAKSHQPPDSVVKSHQPRDSVAEGHQPRDSVAHGHQQRHSVPQDHQQRHSVPQDHQSRDSVAESDQSRDSVAHGHQQHHDVPQDHQQRHSVPQDHQPRDSVTESLQPRDSVAHGHQQRHSVPQDHQPHDSVTESLQPRDSVAHGHQQRHSVPQDHQQRHSVPHDHQQRHSVAESHQPRDSLAVVHQPQDSVTQGHQQRHSVPQDHQPRDSVADLESVSAKGGSLESCAGKPGPPEPVREADPFPMYESHVYDGMYEKVYTDHECRLSSPPEVVSVADVSFDVTGGPDSVAEGHQPRESTGDVPVTEDCADVSCNYKEGEYCPCQPLDLTQVMSADIGQLSSDEWVIKQSVYPVDRSEVYRTDLLEEPLTPKDNRWSL